VIDLSEWVVCDPEILGGRPVFRGSRVPIEVLFENLEDGLSLDEIIDSYPSIPKAAAAALLKALKEAVILSASEKSDNV
jgi:uncharacterized protein (DUF433 family)